ncbi:hypothetical protein AB0D11_37725 [Streptomyces monashensis]|uniref:hypothetical protein n=1 Tax=Streptomyces monashensis TaxID=1678012 RepID=UPI0033CA75CC
MQLDQVEDEYRLKMELQAELDPTYDTPGVGPSSPTSGRLVWDSYHLNEYEKLRRRSAQTVMRPESQERERRPGVSPA